MLGDQEKEIRAVVSLMRELVVIQMDGIILGPAPARVVALQHAAEREPEKPELKQELAEALRNERIAAEHQRLVDLLGRELGPGEFERLADMRNVDK